MHHPSTESLPRSSNAAVSSGRESWSTCSSPSASLSLRLTSGPLLSPPPPSNRGFAYSYATQLTINGIILSLLVVLLIHLLFTAPSHYALARLNFLLQFSGVLVTLIAVAATIGVILSTGSRETNLWPYMTDYIYVDMPPSRWNTGELVLWYTMEAISSGIVQVRAFESSVVAPPSCY